MPKKIKQHDVTDCGAACIASIASHYKLVLPLSRIRQMASTDQKGTNVLGLLEALQKMGFEAKGVRGELSSLFQIPKPAIAHVIIKASLHHYVVIYETSRKFIEVMDPGDGEIHRYKHEEFRKIWTGVLVIMLPAGGFKEGNQKVSVASKFWELIRPHTGIMTQALVGAMVYTLIGLTTSIYVQKIVDYVLVDENRNLLNLMSVIMIVLLVLQMFTSSAKSIFTLRTGQLIDAQLILGYYKHLLRLPQQFFDTMRVGEIISRINDAVKIRTFINDVSINLAVNVFIVFFSFALMFTYYWKLALIVALIVPFYAVVFWISNTLNRKVEREVMERSADLESQLVESLNSVYTIKSFGLERFTNLKTEMQFVALLKAVYTSGMNGIFSSNAAEFFSRAFVVVLLWTGAVYVMDHVITPGELLSFYALAGFFTGPGASLIGMNKTVQHAVIAADRLFEIMDLEIERNENKIKISQEMAGDVIFRDVHFRYGSKTVVFQGLNVRFQRGKVSAVVGESGSGKSSLISILKNLYPIQSGSISIGDYDLRHVDTEALRNFVGIVPQRIDLFSGNVIENIAPGDPEPDMKKILSICSALGSLEFIERLPQGFSTCLGENGATLSGGQRQRLALARALYRDPEILILDEATSSLDSTAEQYVHQTVRFLKAKNKTVIIIAHRLSTILHADKIVVLQNGAIVEEGTHEHLVSNKKQYFKLWKQQTPAMEDLYNF